MFFLILSLLSLLEACAQHWQRTLPPAEIRQAARMELDLHGQYGRDPVSYCRDVLGQKLTSSQEEIAGLLVTPPCKVLVKAAHNVGKSFLAACLVNWWYDCQPAGVCLTTAPTDRQVKDILWKEIRLVRRASKGPRGDFIGPKACRLESGPEHFAHGFTARDGDRFQGQHARAVFIVFDEGEGVGPIFWEAAETMLSGDAFAFLAIYNPTSQSAPTVEAERSGKFHVITMSSLDHPNIAAELQGKPPPYPSAVRLARLQQMLEQWSEPISEAKARELLASAGPQKPVELAGKWYLPGPVARSRLLGERPAAGFDAVWPDWVFSKACDCTLPTSDKHGRPLPVQIGVDVARYGDDDTAIHARQGGSSFHHEAWNGLSIVQIFERVVALCHKIAARAGVAPKRILIAVDDVGVGGGLTDLLRANGWNVVGVNVSVEAPDPAEYPNLRSALWFGLSEEAARGNVSFVELPKAVQDDLRRELTAPVYTVDIRQRRCVEPKDKTKERIKRSPDNADACLLAYANVNSIPERPAGRVEVA